MCPGVDGLGWAGLTGRARDGYMNHESWVFLPPLRPQIDMRPSREFESYPPDLEPDVRRLRRCCQFLSRTCDTYMSWDIFNVVCEWVVQLGRGVLRDETKRGITIIAS